MRFTERVPKTGVIGCRFMLGGWRALLWFPMSIRVGIARGGRPDVRVQAFQFLAGAPVDETVSLNEGGLIRGLRTSLCCAGRVAGIAALHVLVPGFIPILKRIMCVSGLVATFVWRKGKSSEDQTPAESSQLIQWKDFSVVDFMQDISQKMSLPLGVCYVVRELWTASHAESYYLAECSMVMMEVDRDYKRLSRMVAKGQIVGNSSIEKAWLKAHKNAARRMAHLLKDLPDRPPLERLSHFYERHGIVLGRSVGGYALPSHCLDDGRGFSLVVQMCPTKEAEVCRAGQRPRAIHDCVAEGSNRLQKHSICRPFQDRRQSICSQYTRRPISEIMEYPLEAELDLLSSDEDVPAEAEEPTSEVILPLYGRQDHVVEEKKLTPTEKVKLSLRAVRLFLAFLPFILLGIFLLLIAYSLDIQSKHAKRDSKKERCALHSTKRTNWVNRMRTAAFGHLLQGCRDGGAAFIKWGQWSSAREDLFPAEFCDVLSALHDNAPVHAMKQTRKEILRSFGRPIEEIFESFEHQPLASGSVAQVHRALYRKNDRLIPVIVKVRHPNVGQQIHQDFQILKPLAGMATKIPTLKNMPLKESVAQFSNTMTAQTDFRVEAAHILRFSQNFEPVRNAVVIPRVVEELVSESVLVESYEEGVSVAQFIRNPSPLNTKIVTLGVDAYLKMLLTDNFVHTDLHPGNILVREVDQANGEKTLQIVLLDFGLAEELRPAIRKHFISFLCLIAKGDGYNAARHLLQWSENQQCPNPMAFIKDMRQLFASDCNIHSDAGIDLDAVMKSVLRLARKHSVSIDSGYASLVIGVCIIVGFAHSLDPRVNLMDAATPVLLTYALTGRVVGRLYG